VLTLVNERWHHRRYAERDLALLKDMGMRQSGGEDWSRLWSQTVKVSRKRRTAFSGSPLAKPSSPMVPV
jgi:hypothetical protein